MFNNTDSDNPTGDKEAYARPLVITTGPTPTTEQRGLIRPAEGDLEGWRQLEIDYYNGLFRRNAEQRKLVESWFMPNGNAHWYAPRRDLNNHSMWEVARELTDERYIYYYRTNIQEPNAPESYVESCERLRERAEKALFTVVCGAKGRGYWDELTSQRENLPLWFAADDYMRELGYILDFEELLELEPSAQDYRRCSQLGVEQPLTASPQLGEGPRPMVGEANSAQEEPIAEVESGREITYITLRERRSELKAFARAFDNIQEALCYQRITGYYGYTTAFATRQPANPPAQGRGQDQRNAHSAENCAGPHNVEAVEGTPSNPQDYLSVKPGVWYGIKDATYFFLPCRRDILSEIGLNFETFRIFRQGKMSLYKVG